MDPDFLYRRQRLWELREAGVPDDPAEFADQVRKLRAGPILRPASCYEIPIGDQASAAKRDGNR